MAKIVSPTGAVIKGSVCGIAYYRGRDNSICARMKSTVCKRVSTDQNYVRAGVQLAASRWDKLNEEEREGWNEYALKIRQGNTGRQTFIASLAKIVYMARKGTAVGFSTDFPKAGGILVCRYVGTYELAAAGVGFRLRIQNEDATDRCLIQFNIAGPFKSGRSIYKGPFSGYRYSTVAALAGQQPYITFSGLKKNGVYFVKYRGITSNIPTIPHRLSQETIVRAIAKEKI